MENNFEKNFDDLLKHKNNTFCPRIVPKICQTPLEIDIFLKNGCNNFSTAICNPIGFWTYEDIVLYCNENNLVKKYNQNDLEFLINKTNAIDYICNELKNNKKLSLNKIDWFKIFSKYQVKEKDLNYCVDLKYVLKENVSL